MKTVTGLRWALGIALALLSTLGGCGDHDDGQPMQSSDAMEILCAGGGDRRIVNHDDATEIVPPISLAETTDGVTVTVFPPTSQSVQSLYVDVTFTSRGHVDGCSVRTNGSAHVVSVGGRLGVTLQFSQSDLASFVARLIRVPVPDATALCADVTGVADLSISTVRVQSSDFQESIALDGVAIGRTATTFPNAATRLPSCL